MNGYLRDRIAGSRDRNSYRDMDYARGRRRGDRADYMSEYDEYSSRGRDMARGRRGRGYDRASMKIEYDKRGREYDDYSDYGDFEYNYDMHDKPLELKEKEIKEWEKELKNADGSHGGKFSKEQLIPIAQQHGIKFDKFNEEEFTMTVNMMYADYCSALRDSSFSNYSKPEPYVHMAKAFLCDEDFEGEPYEKLALYYYNIVEYED